ncbi:helix-turn-helix domain-containing protein [Streptomyces sp. SM1]|uniref:helix-turn-helix domain-containing protein n=1 Tax=Streptomyces sp. SM1 TaxID=402229 RepID=UPI0015E16AA7|nr:helix-turn-helix domain-containing protein [Streptomyces sp. SM1]
MPVEYPQLAVTWEYVVQDGDVLFPSGMRVEPWPGLPVDERLRVVASFVQTLPLGKFERAARVAAELHLRQGRATPEQMAGAYWPEGKPDDIPEAARALVRDRWPELDPDAGAGAARRWNRLVRLAEVVQEHQAARARGEKAPANVVAEARGVEPGTVRSWLHQARQEGIAPRLAPLGEFMGDVISDIHPDGVIGETGR